MDNLNALIGINNWLMSFLPWFIFTVFATAGAVAMLGEMLSGLDGWKFWVTCGILLALSASVAIIFLNYFGPLIPFTPIKNLT